MPQADKNNVYAYCTDGKGHKIPSPSHEVGAYCSGCFQLIPLRSFPPPALEHEGLYYGKYAVRYDSYLEDGRPLRRKIELLEQKLEEMQKILRS